MDLTRRRKRRFIFLLGLMGLGAVTTWLFWWALAGGLFLRVEPLSEAEERGEVSLEALVMRDEVLITAPAAGTLRPRVPEGERVGKGTLVAYLEAADKRHALFAPRAGVVSYHLDGMETLLDPDDPWASRAIPAARTVERRNGDTLAGGQPVARVVDNLKPVILRVRVEPERLPLGMTTVGARWPVRGQEGEPFTAQVVSLLPDGAATAVCLRVDRYPNRLLDDRRVSCRVVTSRLSGLAVPEKALVTREGRPGLYLVSRGAVHWVPVKVEGRLDGRVFISGRGLEVGTRFVTNPQWAREGARLTR